MDTSIFISPNSSVKEAFKLLDQSAQKLLLVVTEESILLGTLTDGDIRRHILRGYSIDDSISNVYNSNPIVLKKDSFSPEDAQQLILKNKLSLIPVINVNGTIIDTITWDQALTTHKPTKKKNLNLPVVIMAGGKGTRMDPFTRVLPKPLIPIGEKTILEHIISEFRGYSINHFILTLNFKGDMIKAYFNTIEKDYQIEYVVEDDFYGTAGSLKLLTNILPETFIVSNCDIIVHADYEDVLSHHKKQNAALTILSSIQHYKIPYGVVNFKEEGVVTTISEKPEYTFVINTGVYILDKKILDFIPEKEPFDMPNLIQKLIEQGEKVITYPVNENEYIDIGQWKEYKAAIEKFSFGNL